MPSAVARTTYNQLLKDIFTLYENARKGQVRFARETGCHIVEVEQQVSLRAGYGTGLLDTISTTSSKFREREGGSPILFLFEELVVVSYLLTYLLL
jgi:hypothetical protein